MRPLVTRVTCDGVEGRMVSATVKAEISAETSGGFTGGGGMVVSEADLEWARGAGLTSGSRHPWRAGDVPHGGCRVVVETVFPDRAHRWFSGRVERSRTDLAEDTVRSRAVSDAVRLDREVTVPSVAFLMPTRAITSPTARVGMNSSWPTQHVAAQCGFTSVAPIQPEAGVAASMCGSMYPAVGTIRTGWSTTRGQGLSPYARQTWWGGGAMVDPHVVWSGLRPAGVAPSGPLSLIVDIGDQRSTDNFDVFFRLGTNPESGAGVGIRVTGTQYQMIRVSDVGAITLGPTQPRRRHATRVQITHTGATTTLRDDVDAVATWTGGTTLSAAGVTVHIPSGRGDVGAVQMFYAGTDLTQVPRTLRIRRDLYDQAVNGAMSTVPWYQGSAAAYLSAQSQSEKIPMWVDAHGVMHVTDREVLDEQRPTGVVADVMSPNLLTSPGNLFPDPWPSGAGWTALGAVTYPQTPLGPIARVAFPAAGSTSSYSQGLRTTIPVQSGSEVTVSCQVRLVSLADADAAGTVTMSLRGWSRTSTGSLISTADPHQITLAPSQEWSHATVTVPTPLDATQVQVELSNFFPSGGMAAVVEVRHFTTLDGTATLEALAATTASGPGYGRVVVKGEQWVPRTSNDVRILIGAGTRQTMQVGDVDQIVWHPDAETLWLDDSIDLDPALWDSTNTRPHRRVGSVVGGHQFNQNNTPSGLTPSNFTAEMRLVDGRTVAYTGTVNSLRTDGTWAMSTLPNPADFAANPQIPRARESDALPELRTRGVAKKAQHETIIDLGGDGPDHVIDGGHWLQAEHQRHQVATQAAARINDPEPVLEGLRCALAPISEGDRITIRITTVADLTLDVVVQEILPVLHEGHMTMQVRVLREIT